MRLINGRAYSQHELLDEGTPIIRIQNLNGGDRWYFSNLDLPEDKYCSRGDLLFAWSASFGPYIWNGDRSIYHYHIWRIVPFDNIDKQFAFHLLEWITERVKAASHGVAMLHMTKAGMEAWEIPLPPLEEQRRIAAILDQAETLRTQRRQALAHLDTLTQSLFLDMFGDVERNPKGHPKMSLGSLVKLKSGDFLPASKMAADGRHPVYGGNGINGLHDSYMFEESKIVIGRVGAYCGCVHVTKPQSWITDNALYLDSVDRACDMVYLAFALTEARLNQYASQSGQPLISGSRISQVPLLVPPLALQQTFATRIQAIEALKATHRSALAQLDALFASLQQRAFAGEL
jgi:type I restriction enzyme S subunit